MTKLAYDYDSPENNAAVRAARAKLPSTVGNHLEDKRQRVLFREGYAVARAFDLEVLQHEDGMIRFTTQEPPVSCLRRSVARDDPNVSFFAGVLAGSRRVEEAFAGITIEELTDDQEVKLIYDYDSPENNAACLAALANLPRTVGNHILKKEARALYREGRAAAAAFDIVADFSVKDGEMELSVQASEHLSVMDQLGEYIEGPEPINGNHPLMQFFLGVADSRYDKDEEGHQEGARKAAQGVRLRGGEGVRDQDHRGRRQGLDDPRHGRP